MSFNAYLKIEGIDGESLDQAHLGEIEVLSWSWGMSQPGQHMTVGTGLVTTGKPTMQVFSVGKHIDKASPKLFLACATGKHITNAVLTCRKAGGETQQEFIHIKMSNLLVSSYHPSELLGASSQSPVGLDPDGIPVEMVSFNFQKISFEYDAFDAAGSAPTPVVATYDIKTAKGA